MADVVRFPPDIIVRSPEKVHQRMEMGDDFMRQILEEAKVLYEADGGTPVDCR